MRCRAVLSSCSCAPQERVSSSARKTTPFSSPLSFLSRVSLCISAHPFSRVFTFPFPQPRRSLIPNRCRVTTLGNYYRLQHSLPCATASAFARCHVKSFRSALKMSCMCRVSACIRMSEVRVMIRCHWITSRDALERNKRKNKDMFLQRNRRRYGKKLKYDRYIIFVLI